MADTVYRFKQEHADRLKESVVTLAFAYFRLDSDRGGSGVVYQTVKNIKSLAGYDE